MRILFVDSVTPVPYDTLTQSGVGGSEMTLVNVADGLAKRGHVVNVIQHNYPYDEIHKSTGAEYGYSAKYPATATADVVVIQRNAGLVPALRQMYPNARLYLWMHDILDNIAQYTLSELTKMGCSIITVSNWAKEQVRQAAVRNAAPLNILRIYNPVPKIDKPPVEVDTNKLLFPSAPIKGLNETIRVFRAFQNIPKLKDFKLYVCSPGYMSVPAHTDGNITYLGNLSRTETIEHMASSFAVFSANTYFPETFGLVYAEANAVGTPFLIHNRQFAVKEHSTNLNQYVDMRDVGSVIDKLIEWKQNGRPAVSANPNLYPDIILDNWEKL